MFTRIAYYPILGKPLMLYLGILTLSFLLATAFVAYLHSKGYFGIPFKWHIRLAKITLILALIHGTLGILANFIG